MPLPRKILGIDPGPETSGLVVVAIGDSSGWPIHLLRAESKYPSRNLPDMAEAVGFGVTVEDIACQGQVIGHSTIETCKLIGRIQDRAERLGTGVPPALIKRVEVKTILLGRAVGNDSAVTSRVREIVGAACGLPPEDRALKGTTKSPGPLHGIAGHAWQALAAVLAQQWRDSERYRHIITSARRHT